MAYYNDPAPLSAPAQSDFDYLDSLDYSDLIDPSDPRVYHPTTEEIRNEERRHRKEMDEENRWTAQIEGLLRLVDDEEISFDDMADKLKDLCPTACRPGDKPQKTTAWPGSEEKIQILQNRAARGETLFHREDPHLYRHVAEESEVA